MFIYLLLLVTGVFTGSEILAVSTPLAQITLYRLLALGVVPLLMVQLYLRNPQLKLVTQSWSTRMLMVFLSWWIVGLLTGLWALDFISWVQVSFLMTVGILSIVALYLWSHSWHQWLRLLEAMWVMMTGLLVWGYFEIITNTYLFADMVKLDKYNTFASQPWTRIPITTFANQNDYATMLLAYLAIGLILLKVSQRNWLKVIMLVSFALGSFLVYQSGSRMALLCLIILLGFLMIEKIDWDFSFYQWALILIAGASILILSLIYLEPLRETLDTIFYFGGPQAELPGDTKRMNIWRNGLFFLSQTLGLGVGSGNIEHWAAEFSFWPTNEITNMHNWWLEILVSNGVIPFLLYVWGYFGMMQRLYHIYKQNSATIMGHTAKLLFAFMLIFILASITSANNMLIEWHWVFFGMIIAFIKVVDLENQEQGKFSPGKVKEIGKEKLPLKIQSGVSR